MSSPNPSPSFQHIVDSIERLITEDDASSFLDIRRELTASEREVLDFILLSRQHDRDPRFDVPIIEPDFESQVNTTIDTAADHRPDTVSHNDADVIVTGGNFVIRRPFNAIETSVNPSALDGEALPAYSRNPVAGTSYPMAFSEGAVEYNDDDADEVDDAGYEGQAMFGSPDYYPSPRRTNRNGPPPYSENAESTAGDQQNSSHRGTQSAELASGHRRSLSDVIRRSASHGHSERRDRPRRTHSRRQTVAHFLGLRRMYRPTCLNELETPEIRPGTSNTLPGEASHHRRSSSMSCFFHTLVERLSSRASGRTEAERPSESPAAEVHTRYPRTPYPSPCLTAAEAFEGLDDEDLFPPLTLTPSKSSDGESQGDRTTALTELPGRSTHDPATCRLPDSSHYHQRSPLAESMAVASVSFAVV